MYRTALGDHPLPSFSSWRQAADFVRTMRGDKAGLDQLQSRIGHWWKSRKAAWPREVAEFIEVGASGAHRARLDQRFSRWNNDLYQPQRMMELLRQQTVGQVAGRIVRVSASLTGQKTQASGVWGLSAQTASSSLVNPKSPPPGAH
jgi:hypothetical protein